MRDPNDKTSQRPADIRSISDPPDMGKLRPAEDVAKEMVERFDDPAHDRPYSSFILDNWCEKGTDLCLEECLTKERRDAIAGKAEALLANLIRQSRAEGAAAALEAASHSIGEKASEHDSLADCAEPHEAAAGYHFGKAEAYRDAATLLRARIKSISDPPDMG